MDVELDRKIAGNWREYLKELSKTKKMIVWVWREMINAQGRRAAKKMILALAINCAIGVAAYWFLSMIFDGLQSGQPRVWGKGLVLFSAFSLLGMLTSYKFAIYREFLFGERGRQLDLRATELFFEKSLGVHIGENNLLSDASMKKGYDRVVSLQDMLLFQGVQNLLNLLFSFCALWLLDWVSALMATLIVFLHFGWSLFLNLRVLQVCTPLERKWRAIGRFRIERWKQVERVKTCDKEKEEVEKLEKKHLEIIGPDRKFWYWFIAQANTRGAVVFVVFMAVMLFGIYSVYQNRITYGLLIPLVMWAKQLADNLWQVGNIEQNLNNSVPSILAMKEALELPSGLAVCENPAVLSKDAPCWVEFKGVGFSYCGQMDENGNCDMVPVLNEISFAVEPGQKVALIGSSGAGKTTIMRLLLRFMDPTAGRIMVDGKNLKELDLGSWLRLVGYIPQDAQIFDGTIKDNLIFGLPEHEAQKISDDELWYVCRQLKIDFGERLTHGLYTKVGEDGIKLSGGQAQRIMIGAAVLKNPRFMIIDEATSSLDGSTVKVVQEGLRQILTGDRSALIITHRLNTVRRICDKFIMLNGEGDGKGSKVAAIASSFEELAELSPAFRSLAMDEEIVL